MLCSILMEMNSDSYHEVSNCNTVEASDVQILYCTYKSTFSGAQSCVWYLLIIRLITVIICSITTFATPLFTHHSVQLNHLKCNNLQRIVMQPNLFTSQLRCRKYSLLSTNGTKCENLDNSRLGS